MILLCTSTLGTKVLTDNLYNELFTNANYKPQLLPVCEVGISVNISLDIALRQIVSLDCQLKLGSWSHSNADLDFYPQKDTVEKLKSARNVKTYGNETYTDITYHIEMRRRSAFYVMTMMLSITPRKWREGFLGGTYFAVSMMLVGLSLVLAVLVLNVHHRGDIPGKIVPKWSRTFFLEKLSMLCTRKKYRTSGNMNNVKRQCPTEHGVAYEMNSFNHNTRLTSLSENENSETNPQNLTNNNDILKEQLKELQAIRSHFLVDDTTEVEQEDWQRLARVLDRIFLCLYVLCFTIVTLVFVLQLTGGQDVT
ncbi:ACHA6-like protein [Mya arenaria]|uniref:ACHA6-like protein n=1 Tax=Mya arenaria TaxID=6604 RepID=A0ABY7DFF5_MYAAR|nr:ACHA6-like protein [Mya arenaria]